MTEASTFSCGKSMPRLPQNRRDHAPPASTTLAQAIRPFSVTTAATRPPGGVDAAHRASGQDRGALAPCRLGDRGCRPLRLGLAVARGVKPAGPIAGQPRHQLGRLGAGQQARVELVLPRVIEPGFELAQLGRGLGEVHDAGLAKAGFGLDPLVHPLPQPQAFDDQRQFAGVARPSCGTSPNCGSTARRRCGPFRTAPPRRPFPPGTAQRSCR